MALVGILADARIESVEVYHDKTGNRPDRFKLGISARGCRDFFVWTALPHLKPGMEGECRLEDQQWKEVSEVVTRGDREFTNREEFFRFMNLTCFVPKNSQGQSAGQGNK